MKTKQYTFTINEVQVLREACVNLFQEYKLQNAADNINAKISKALAEQLKRDIVLWYE